MTKIYLTNGNYLESSGYSSDHGIPNKIDLTLKSIRTLANNFYEKSVEFLTGLLINDTLYNALQRFVISTKTEMDFQSICDIIYFSKLFKNGKKNTFDGKVSTELHISSNLLVGILEKILSEIDELEKITLKCNSSDNLLPQGDMAYKRNVKISYDKDKKVYLEFIDFIDEIAKNDKSFIFKYLKIENLKMSSGERAYLNFFSWLNLLSFFHKISQNVLESTRENILLLIGEIELYCHPEWQRQFMSFLLEELSNQFANKKIQIIFATHSPVVLSDIPLSNTVYISRDNNENIKIERKSYIRKHSHRIFIIYIRILSFLKMIKMIL